jgi:hypothetical protein
MTILVFFNNPLKKGMDYRLFAFHLMCFKNGCFWEGVFERGCVFDEKWDFGGGLRALGVFSVFQGVNQDFEQ